MWEWELFVYIPSPSSDNSVRQNSVAGNRNHTNILTREWYSTRGCIHIRSLDMMEEQALSGWASMNEFQTHTPGWPSQRNCHNQEKRRMKRPPLKPLRDGTHVYPSNPDRRHSQCHNENSQTAADLSPEACLRTDHSLHCGAWEKQQITVEWPLPHFCL